MFNFKKFNFKNKNKKIFLDNASSTTTLSEVEEEMNKYKDLFYNPSAIYSNAVQVRNIINNCRDNIARILSCHSNEIYFASSGTESINMALSGVIKNYYIDNIWIEKKNKTNIQAKPIIITTNIEHPAVIETLKWYEKMDMIEIIYLKVNNYGLIKLQDLRDLLANNNIAENILMVSVMYVNNEIGTLLPVREIGKIIADYNRENRDENNKIIYHIDACQAVNYYEINVRKLRADLLSFNSSKIYAGHGGAVLYKNNKTKIEPIIYGGAQERGLRSGTENIHSIIAISKALQIISTDRESEMNRLRELQEYFFQKIKKELSKCKIWGPTDELLEYRSPNNINISLPGIVSDDFIIRLDYKGFELSHKSACDSHNQEGSYVLSAIGATTQESNENIRITMGRNTKRGDLDKLIENIIEIYNKYYQV